ncbi:MAG: hypothetical protein V4726_12870 [Verrucomicrobiota bacterium]
MNTLVSWIDADALSGMARNISAEPADGVTWAPATGEDTPVTRLVAEDFQLPEHFSPEPFPVPGPTVPPEERSKVRNFLAEIRQKAEHSGLIPRPVETPGAAVSGGDNAGAGSAIPAKSATGPGPVTVGEMASAASAPAVPRAPAVSALFRTTPVSLPPIALVPLPAAAPAAEPHAPLHLPPLASSASSGMVPAVPSTPASPETAGVPPLRRQVPHFEVPLGPMSTRIRALTDWIRRQIETSEIFILDTQGCPVGDREAIEEIVASAVVLAEAARHAAGYLPDGPTGALYLDLEDERRLCVISTPTSHGNFILGLILPEALAPRAADRLRRALKRTIEADAPAPLRLPPRERW